MPIWPDSSMATARTGRCSGRAKRSATVSMARSRDSRLPSCLDERTVDGDPIAVDRDDDDGLWLRFDENRAPPGAFPDRKKS